MGGLADGGRREAREHEVDQGGPTRALVDVGGWSKIDTFD